MAYIKIYKKWLPYAKMSDTRGFISRQFGAGHTGVDSVGNLYGNKICAVMDGKVTRIDNSKTLGNVLEYENGNIRIAHYHLAKTLVKVGDNVKTGETLLAVEGSTGSLATGKHLHTSIWINGKLADPEPYLNGTAALPVQLKDDLSVLRQENARLTTELAKANDMLAAVRKAVRV